MTHKGLDTCARLTADNAVRARAAGLDFVARYLVPESYAKALTTAEAQTINDAGLAILLCWETTAQAIRQGAARGAADGAWARQLAQSMGVPAGTIIFFAADYAAPVSDYGDIRAYLNSAQLALGPYRAGLYGNYSLVEAMGLPSWQCVGGSGGLWSNVAQWRQLLGDQAPASRELAKKTGILAVDVCEADTLDGLWQPAQKTHWYDDTMKWAKDSGINDGTRPEAPATRAEVSQMLRNLVGRFGPEDDKRLSGLLEEE